MSGSRGMIIEVYRCLCGKNTMPIVRSIRSCRKMGHMKKLYCPICKKFRSAVKIG